MPSNDIIFTPHERAMAGYNSAARAIEYKDTAIPLRVSSLAYDPAGKGTFSMFGAGLSVPL